MLFKRKNNKISPKVISCWCLLALARAAPTAEAEAKADADPLLLGHPLGYRAAPAANCEVSHEILTTQTCVPSTENVCETVTVDTEEIEYEKVCKEVVDYICDAPLGHHLGKRAAEAEAEAEADPEADPQFLVGHPGYPPVSAHAVAHSVTANVKHACREVTTEHCVDNPVVKPVPVEVEHCHTVTKVACSPVENKLPKTTCTPVETQHVAHAGYAHPYGK